MYVHVPFCRSKCPYCDFFSVASPEAEVVQRVLGQIELQLECFGQALEPTRVETVYVGGGTPSLLPPDRLDRLLESIGGFVGAVGRGDERGCGPAEWTVEANPESLSREHLAVCASRGVNRLSIGIQSFDPRILSTLGRPAGPDEAREALRLAREHWSGQVNLDLMSGAPGEDWQVLRRDLEEALVWTPEHLSLYSLSLDDPEHPLARDSDPDSQDRLWLRGHRWLEERGYRNYEISNFAPPGCECRHNLRYWRLEPYLGCGPGAVSTLPGRKSPELPLARGAAVLRLTNPRSLDRFLGGPDARWGLEVEEITPREFLFETLMMGLRLRDGIDAAALAARFGRSFPELVPGLWGRWNDRRLCDPAQDRYALSFEGRMILDRLLLELQEALEGAEPEDLFVRWD